MRTKLVAGVVLGVAALAVTTLAAVSPVQTAVVRFMRPTIIAGAAVLGTVVFEHDAERMARGEPCTTVYYYDAGARRRGRMLVEFMCIPVARDGSRQFEATISRSDLTGPDRLTEYRFAGELEGHGVPVRPGHQAH